jgi:hypothetical protein
VSARERLAEAALVAKLERSGFDSGGERIRRVVPARQRPDAAPAIEQLLGDRPAGVRERACHHVQVGARHAPDATGY